MTHVHWHYLIISVCQVIWAHAIVWYLRAHLLAGRILL